VATADAPRPAVGPLRCSAGTKGEANAGDGPLELHNYPYESDGTTCGNASTPATGASRSGPSVTPGQRPARPPSPTSASIRRHLHTIREDGTPGVEVARGPDKGICLADVAVVHLGDDRTLAPVLRGSRNLRRRRPQRPPATPPIREAPTSPWASPSGAADVYPWYIGPTSISTSPRVAPTARYLLRVENRRRPQAPGGRPTPTTSPWPASILRPSRANSLLSAVGAVYFCQFPLERLGVPGGNRCPVAHRCS